MAIKPRSQWSDSYRRRIERAEAKGISKQKARGHAAKEHASRKQNKVYSTLVMGALSPNERGQITKYMQRLPSLYDTPANKQKLMKAVEAKGFEWFKGVRNARNELIKTAKERPSGSGILEVMYDLLDIEPELDFTLFYMDA